MTAPIFINAFSVSCALGAGREAVGAMLASPHPPVLARKRQLIDGRETTVGELGALPVVAGADTRTNRLVAALMDEIRPELEEALAQYGPSRVGFILGASTSGIDEATRDLKVKVDAGAFPAGYRFSRMELGDPVEFGSRYSSIGGPAYVVSTACTSGAKAMAAGARMIAAGLVDAVVCGGADTLCDLTLNGFAALESIAPGVCNPMSLNRCGINIGEGGALFLMSRQPGPWRLEGYGESSDAHHASAPDPSAAGAEMAVRRALGSSGIAEADVGFIHLHGTATRLNDQMEAVLVERLFGLETPCASTKPLTGHTLGAAGGVQAALSLLALERGVFPPHLFDGERDRDLASIRLALPGERPDMAIDHLLSLSFAFGGNNIALVLGRG